MLLAPSGEDLVILHGIQGNIGLDGCAEYALGLLNFRIIKIILYINL